ncbi:hypothetical protein QR685DRAFT_437700 [Neurospora intermedia]|uniref:Uncharacterized protein n=1 Tax=Neurospora intermedia TaxID=5142 RepID=A0ABR3DFP5_NEUIN
MMHGSKHTAALFALAYGRVVLGLEDIAPVTPAAAATVPNPQSLYIQFMHPTPRSYGYGQDLGFRLNVNPSVTNLPIRSGNDDSCASPNITINNQPLLSPPNEDESFVLDNDINVHLTWESRCFPGGDSSADVENADDSDSLPNGNPENNKRKGVDVKARRSQSVTLTLQAIDGQPVKEELSCTIWFRQEEPVWAFGVAGWCVDARIRDVKGKKTGGWEVVFDNDDDEGGDAEAGLMGTTEGKGESREERLKRERKEFEREVKCLEYQKSIATAEERDSTGVVGHGYAQKPVVMNRKYEGSRQHFGTLCANLPPRTNDTSTPGPSAHPPWELPHHRPAKPARLPFPDLSSDSIPGSAHQTTLNSRPSSLRASVYAHLINLSPIRLAAYIIFLSLLILACFFHSLHRQRSRRKRLAERSRAGEPVAMIESLCPGFYGSDESCGECKAKYFAQLQAGDESETGTGESEGESDSDTMTEKRGPLQEKEGSLEEKEEGISELHGEEQDKKEKERLSEREYQRYCEYHAVPSDGLALRYEPGSELQTVHEPVEQVVVVDDDDDDDERVWDEKETLVDSEDEREKEHGDEAGESSGEDSGGEDSDDGLSIGGELASFMRAANLVEDMIRAGARREAAPRPQAAPPVNTRRQLPGTPPPPSYGEVVGLRGVVDDEGLLPPRYEEYLRSRR